MTDAAARDLIDPTWHAGAKYDPVRVNVELVQRDRLLNILDGGLNGRLAFVLAPAGFGKSTLLSQWRHSLQARGTDCAWITLDESDADPNQFLASLVISLSHAGIDIGDLEVGARNSFAYSPVDVLLGKIVRLLADHGSKTVIILDDYHCVDNPEINEMISALARDPANDALIVINSRSPPRLDVAAQIATGAAFQIGPEHLRLDRGETATILGEAAQPGFAKDVFERTEGWPIAVQLARAQNGGMPHSPYLAAENERIFASYLADEVLAKLSAEERRLLLMVSALERFNADLADVVCGWQASGRLIRQLEKLAALIVPLDYDRQWYRLHSIFAGFLKERLREQDPAKVKEALLRASAWHVDHGEIIESVRYAADARQFDVCERLIVEAGGWKIVLTEGIGVAKHLLRPIPPAFIDDRPRLVLTQAYLRCKEGHHGESRLMLEAIRSKATATQDAGLKGDFASVEAIIDSYEDREEWAYDIGDRKSSECIPRTFEPLEEGSHKCHRAMVEIVLGRFTKANDELRAALRFMRQSGSVIGLYYCHLHSAIAAIHTGDFDIARANIARAVEMSEGNFGIDSGLKYLALALNFAIRIWQGDALEDERSELIQAIDQIADFDGWADVYLHVLDASYWHARPRADAAFRRWIIGRFGEVARDRNLDRLERTATVFAIQDQDEIGADIDRLLQIEQIASWLRAQPPAEHIRSWLCYFHGASMVARNCPGDNGEAVSFLEKAIAHSDAIGAVLHSIRLRVSLVLCAREARKDEARTALREAVDLAIQTRCYGALASEPDLREPLRDLASRLRNDDRAQLAYAFVMETLRRIDQTFPAAPSMILSPREHEILGHLAQGLSNKQIARELGLTDNTIKFHMKGIFTKLTVNKRSQAITRAHAMGLLTNPACA